jgi:hypothetical protein
VVPRETGIRRRDLVDNELFLMPSFVRRRLSFFSRVMS